MHLRTSAFVFLSDESKNWIVIFLLEVLTMTGILKRKATVAAALCLWAWNLLLPCESYAESYAGQCDDLLAVVGQKIESANFLGNKAETNPSNLLAKLDGVQAQIYLEIYSDVITKLGNISDTATDLANAPKPKLEDASTINYAVSNAIDCVGALP